MVLRLPRARLLVGRVDVPTLGQLQRVLDGEGVGLQLIVETAEGEGPILVDRGGLRQLPRRVEHRVITVF